MAEIVLGVGTSHSPQLSIPWTQWNILRVKDETDTRLDYPTLLQRAKPDIESELTTALWEQRDTASQRALGVLRDRLHGARPDVVVMFGDDQHEQFHDDNMPAMAIYHGESLPVRKRTNFRAEWMRHEAERWAETASEYPAAPELATHLIGALAADDFDVTRCNSLREDIGVGHAFSFLYRRLWPDDPPPVVPIMINTYFPPNQPTPRRCYALGQAVRRAIEAWDRPARVAVMASGGLSHVVIDEELDQMTLADLQAHDRDALCALPRERLWGGTSEILNWVALYGVVEDRAMTLVDYVPSFRTLAGTGCAAAFAYWE